VLPVLEGLGVVANESLSLVERSGIIDVDPRRLVCERRDRFSMFHKRREELGDIGAAVTGEQFACP
jgi:hypothetical protein